MIILREVKEKDCDLLFNWTNDSMVRKNSFNTKLIKYEEHKTWFFKMLKDDKVLFYIMENKDIPIGQIRININKENAIISYSISRNYRGKGFGLKIIQMAETKLINLKEVKKVIAYVKEENLVSKKIFKKLNYTEELLADKNLYYKLINKI